MHFSYELFTPDRIGELNSHGDHTVVITPENFLHMDYPCVIKKNGIEYQSATEYISATRLYPETAGNYEIIREEIPNLLSCIDPKICDLVIANRIKLKQNRDLCTIQPGVRIHYPDCPVIGDILRILISLKI